MPARPSSRCAVAAPFEGLDAQTIHYNFGSTCALVDEPLQEELSYTDDTQLSIAVAEALLDCGRIEDESLSRAFVANYDPACGYGQGACRIIEAMESSADWRALAKSIFPGGSLGNGAAMRVAPVGQLFHARPKRHFTFAPTSSSRSCCSSCIPTRWLASGSGWAM